VWLAAGCTKPRAQGWQTVSSVGEQPLATKEPPGHVAHCTHVREVVGEQTWPRRKKPVAQVLMQRVQAESLPTQSLKVPLGQVAHRRSVVRVGARVWY
jgi:hypothetical protein